jgi:hypothetical protein
MLFYLYAISFLILGATFSEAVLFLLLHKKLHNNRAYIYKFLLTNDSGETLEDYVIRQFFPRYFIQLFCLLSVMVVSHILPHPFILLLSSIGLITFLRIFNRNIFSNLWTIIHKM